MDENVSNVVEAILTAILQWRVKWLDEQRTLPKPPPICRTEPRKLKIIYESYKDYESTMVPLLMHEIWAQIYEEWLKLDNESLGSVPMEVDQVGDAQNSIVPMDIDDNQASSSYRPTKSILQPNNKSVIQVPLLQRQFWIGVAEYRTEGQYQCLVRCQFVVDSNKYASHVKLIAEGDLVRLDLVAIKQEPAPTNPGAPGGYKSRSEILSLFGYVRDLNMEKLGVYTELAPCFIVRPRDSHHVVINYNVIIAKRLLKLDTAKPMKMTGLYYLKPMIRQIESVALLKESPLASDILCPRPLTCQLSVPTINFARSPDYNEMQYNAIIGVNEALMRRTPKIQLIQGPPGTGKTHTLIGIIKHFYKNLVVGSNPSKLPKILICAPSNGAIDEVSRRLYKEREFLKRTPAKRSLRLIRVGNPDHINPNIKCISLEELVESNIKKKAEEVKDKLTERVSELEAEICRCDTEISNLRYSDRKGEIPGVEDRMAKMMKEVDQLKSQSEVKSKREASEASKSRIRFTLVENADVVLTTLNSCQRHPLDSLFRNTDDTFRCVIVDEASQCCEPELLMPLCYRITKMILIGDPMQLPATVISRYAQSFDFGRSLFERFFKHFGEYSISSPIAMLTQQYRMHPEICSFPSRQFYDNRLVSATRADATFPLNQYILFDLKHSSESKAAGSSSVQNAVEADFIRNLLVAVMSRAPENSKIGVITPYKSQKNLITRKIVDLQSEKNIKVEVNTCDGFQGQEKDIIILSCVRAFSNTLVSASADLLGSATNQTSNGSIGFLKSIQRVNVALTRAKHSLIVVVAAKSLSNDKTWAALIDDARERRRLQALTHTPSANLIMNLIAPISR